MWWVLLATMLLAGGLRGPEAHASTIDTSVVAYGTVDPATGAHASWRVSGGMLGPNPADGFVSLYDEPFPCGSGCDNGLLDQYRLVVAPESMFGGLTATHVTLEGTSTQPLHPIVDLTLDFRVVGAYGDLADLEGRMLRVTLTGSVPTLNPPIPVGTYGVLTSPGVVLIRMKLV